MSIKGSLDDGLVMGPVITIHSVAGYRAPCEPSISINPTNPDIILAGSVLDNVYWSVDGGRTWSVDKLTSTYGVYGDPVIRSNMDGSFLYAHLSNPQGKAYQSDSFLDRIVVQRTNDGGETWSNGSFPEADTLKDHDKHWLCTGKNGLALMSWTEFDTYGDTSDSCRSRILFSSSYDGGQSWSQSQTITMHEGDCVDNDNTSEGAVPAVGPANQYYVVWSRADTLWFNRSFDKGSTWLASELPVGVQYGGWAMNIPGLQRCNGMPVLKCDLSEGPHRGRLYVVWADQKNGSDDTDIWIKYSDDEGMNWSSPRRINDDSGGRHQYLPWVDVDPVTGYLYVVFYDRRRHTSTMTDVYLAYSVDGGETFRNERVNHKPFKSEEVGFFGDYNDISTYRGRIRPIWTWQNGKTLSIQTALIEHDIRK